MARRRAEEPEEVDGFTYVPGATSSSPLRVEAMSVEGFENGGKTSFALSASAIGPVAFIAMDSGWRVVEWFWEQGRKIGLKKLLTVLPDGVEPDEFVEVTEAMKPKLKEVSEACRRVIDKRYYACVIDTGSDLEDLVGYALNGKISLDVWGGEGRLKKALNSTMASLYRLFESSDTNLIVTHKLGSFKGEIYPLGWKLTNYECPYVVRAVFDHEIVGDPDSPKKHFIEIVKSKYKPELQGKRVRVNRLDGYAKVAKMLLPGGDTDDSE